jgi:hypothetical protein
MLAAASPRHSSLGGNRHQPELARKARGTTVPVEHLDQNAGEHRGQRIGQLAASPLLVGEQRIADRTFVRACGHHRRQAGRTRVGPGRPRST